jgi:hypothetical protein
LVEVVDDSLSDKHANPLQNYWDDDAVEIFLDEDHSGGNHENANAFNAFAYHVSKDFDVADYNKSGAALFNNDLEGARSRQDNLYTWEFAIKVYKNNYVYGSSNTPATLTKDKEMGFSLAYCDNDGGDTRENFIGSKYQTSGNANRSYQDASLFSKLVLKDTTSTPVNPTKLVNINSGNCIIYPNPAKNYVYYQLKDNGNSAVVAKISSISGQELYNETIANNSGNGFLSIDGLKKGIYFVEIINQNLVYSGKIIVL